MIVTFFTSFTNYRKKSDFSPSLRKFHSQSGSFPVEAWQEGGNKQHSKDGWGSAYNSSSGSSDGVSAHGDLWPTEAGLCLDGHQAPESLECCVSRQLRGNEDPGEPMAWTLLHNKTRRGCGSSLLVPQVHTSPPLFGS